MFLLNVSFLLVHADLCSSDSLSRADFANLSCILGCEHPFTVLCSRSVRPSEAPGVFSKHTHTSSFPWQTTSAGCLRDTLLIHSCAVCSYESKEQFLVSFADVLQLCGNATVATSVNKELKKISQGFPGGSVLTNPPVNAGVTGLIPGPGRPHMPRRS